MNGLVKPCPPAGHGVHSWAFHAYNKLRSLGFTHEQAESYCHKHATRLLHSGDIPNAPAEATEHPKSRPRHVFELEKLKALAAKLADFDNSCLAQRSPIDPKAQTSTSFLRLMFMPGERVLLTTNYETAGKRCWELPDREHVFAEDPLEGAFRCPIRGNGAWFLANPVNGQKIKVRRLVRPENPEGATWRSEENLTAFRFLVLESDVAPPELWLPALAQLPLGIASITTSGGKSIHALVRIDARDAAEWRAFRDRIAPAVITLGADPAAMSLVRLTRLPGSYRQETGKWQKLLFLNPHPSGVPICELPILRPEGGGA